MNAFEGDAYDVITIAAVANDVEMVRLALSLGGNPGNITSPYDGTALIAAAHLGHFKVVTALIEAGAPLDHINNLGWTALIEAVVLGDGGPRHVKTTRALIEAGADITISDRQGITPLAHAKQRELPDLLDILISSSYMQGRVPICKVLEGRSEMAKKGPGRAYREGLTIVQLMDMFPTEEAATAWFESVLWPDGERHCGKCGSIRTREVPSAKPMPYWCTDCRGYFSVRTGTPLARSNVPMRKWVIAIYLCLTSLKSVSSMKLSRDIGVKQETAWFMLHRIREAWSDDAGDDPFDGPVEVDETYFGGKRKNMSNAKRKELADTGRGAAGKTAVVGMKDRATNEVRAEVVTETDSETLQDFVEENTEDDAKVFTDDAAAYKGVERTHKAVRHSVSEYVNGMAHTNGIESFWSMLKRAHKGTFNKMSPKHLQRYVSEFAGKHNIRDSGTLVQMRDTVARLVGRNLLYRDLIADNGLSSGARS